MNKFKGKAVMTVEELNANEINHDNGWVLGNLIGNVICGSLLETSEDAIIVEWWALVIPETIHQVNIK